MKRVFTTLVVLTLVGILCAGTVWGADAKGNRDLLRSMTPTELKAARTSGNSTQAVWPADANKTLAAVVYVDDNWVAVAPGADPDDSGPATAMGTDAFASIQEGIDAVDAGGMVNVYPGAYSETAANRFLYDGVGPYQFGLFFGAAKPGITVQGVNGAGAPVTAASNAVALVTTNATNSFGASGFFVEADNITIAGLKILDNVSGNNKTIEVIGDNVAIRKCWMAVTDGGSFYINDWRYDAGTNVSYVKAYTIDGNILEDGGSIDIASGPGYTGPTAGRVITNNVFNIPSGVNWAVVSFSGSGTGVPWFVYSVGGAMITGNTFNGGDQHIIRARGLYDNTQFDWASYWNNNTFSRKVAFGTNPPSVMGTFSYPSGEYTMNNVRHIAGLVQPDIDYAQAGDAVIVGAGTYREQIEITKGITLSGDVVNPANVVIDGENKTGLAKDGQIRIYNPSGNVIFEGFSIINGGCRTVDGYYAVLTKGNFSKTIRNCRITGHGASVDIGSDYGIWAYTATGELTIKDSYLGGMYHAILLEQQYGAVSIENNIFDDLFTGPYSGGVYGGRAIEAINYGSTDVTSLQKVSGNVFTNFRSTGVLFSGGFTGQTPRKFTNVLIEKNTFTFSSSTIGNLLGAICLKNVSTPANNSADGGVTAEIRNNTVNVPSGSAIQISGLNGTITCAGNSVIGLPYAIKADASLGSTIDASGNWFGSTSPSPVILGSVDFTPCLMSGVDTAPVLPGFQGDFSTLQVSAASPQSGEVTRVHEALGMVDAGGTVNIAAGTYVEGPQVVVNTNVTVAGADKNTVIITPSANTGTAGDARGWFLVNPGKTFNLSGVTLDGAGKLVNIGIISKGPGTITNNILTNLGYNPGGPDYAGRGIAIYEANMTISNNALNNIGRIGIYMYGTGVTNGVVTGNTYTGKGAGNWLDYGIEVEGGAHATITNNTVTNCLGVASVDGSTSAGVLATTYFAAGTTVNATDNTFTNNTAGLAIGYDGTDVTAATISGNDFTGCSYGVTSTAPVADARNNWWGNGSGPSGGVADPATATLANGTGVLVSEHVRFDPWSGKAEIVNVPAPGSYSWPQSDVTIVFGTVPPGGGTVTVQRLNGVPPNPPYPAPPAGATYIPLWLMLSSTMPNYSFSATITIDVSDIAGFGATSQIMYLNSITNTWVPVGGTYDDVAKTFTFTTTHFTPYAFVNTPATAFNLYVSSSPATTSGGIYPNDTWGMPSPLPAGYPHATRVPGDWGYTGTQTVDVYIVPQAGMEFGAADLTLEWDAAYLDYSAVSFTGSVFGGGNVLFANSDRLGTTNRIRINASLTSPNNVTTAAGNYIAKLTLRIVKPGHSAVSVIASDLRQYAGAGAPLGLYVTPHQGDVRVYLGDVSSTATDLSADGKIDIADLNSWAYSYWSGVPGYQFGMTNYKVKFDIGPTADHYVFSMPQVDGKIDFEDLIVFSISYGLSANHQLPKQAVEQAEPVTVAAGDAKVGGGETRVPVLLEGTVADLRGLSLSFNGSHGRLLGVEKGALLSGYETPVPVLYCERDGKVFVDLAIAGAKAEALNSAGEVVVLRFEGKASMNVTSADARTSSNTTLATKVRATVQNELPTEFALQQNYPNPFNPSTTVSYALPAVSNVRIAVYNVLGEQVALLSDGMQEAGFYTAQWNGTDSRGQHVTSGVYFLTMRAGEFTAMKKMMLVK